MVAKKNQFNQLIKKYRLVNQVRQEDMAKAIGVSRATLINYEKGHTSIPIEVIDKFTEDRLERHRQERESKVKREKERHESKRLEQLFNLKLQTFEIPEIKESTNRKLKAKIRKAKNLVEMNAYATILLMENMSEQSGESK